MNYTQITEIERYQIKAYLTAGYPQKAIAYELNLTPPTISRALKRNRGLRGYRPEQAQRLANGRKQRHSHVKISDTTWRIIVSLLKEDWSPEQINGWLNHSGQQSVSIEWIDHYILTDKKAGGELYRHLRCQKKRRKRYGSVDKRGQIKNRVSIDERPAIVDTRQRVGDGEMDLIIGRIGGSVLMTAVERKTRYTLIGFAPNKTAEKVKNCIIDVMAPLASLVKTQTYDNGKEFALHESIAEALEARSYFTHPYHSWE